MVEQRRSHRAPLDAAVQITRKNGAEATSGIARDVSIGGVFVETVTPLPFGTEVVLHLRVPSQKEELLLPGVVRWTRQDGMGVQFGLLGARETHVITEIVRKAAQAV